MIIFRVSSGYKPSRNRKISVSIDKYYANLNANFLEEIAAETDIQLKFLNNTNLQSVTLINLSHLAYRKNVFDLDLENTSKRQISPNSAA
jgi:hypothetical protein